MVRSLHPQIQARATQARAHQGMRTPRSVWNGSIKGPIRRASHLMGSVLDGIPSAPQRGASEQLHMGIVHGVNPEEAQPLFDDLGHTLKPDVTLFGEIGPGLGVHVGPGTIGVCWLSLPA